MHRHEASGLIVAQAVVNDESDNNMLTPMIEKVGENLGEKAEETAADGDYYSPEQLVKAEEAGMDVFLNVSEKQKDPYRKELLAKLMQIVEPVFGIIKHCMGF